LMKKMKIFDGHNDILNKISNSDSPQNTAGFLKDGEGHLDLPRAIQGGMVGGLFAAYTSVPPDIPEEIVLNTDGYEFIMAPALEFDFAHQSAKQMVSLLEMIEQDSGGKVKIVRNIQELDYCLKEDIFAAVMHLEGAEPILTDLSNLDDFYNLGMRSLGITWSRPNNFGFGVPFKFPSSSDTGPGLTSAGKDLVMACNELGIMIDLAHLNEKGFWDVAELSSAPLVSSHSAAHSLTPMARNLTDEQFKTVAETDGLVGVIFSVNDLDGGKRPIDDAPISSIITHIQYVSDLIGVDHIAFGSDFDGTLIPSELGDASRYQLLVSLLEEAGFSPEEQEKICHKNWIRVLKATWK